MMRLSSAHRASDERFQVVQACGRLVDRAAFHAQADGLVELFDDAEHIENRIGRFCDRFPNDKKHRWVKDLAAELLHNADPERVPLMNRWVWDAKANTGVIREIWHGDNVDHMTIPVGDGYGTYIMLREELSQFLSGHAGADQCDQ